MHCKKILCTLAGLILCPPPTVDASGLKMDVRAAIQSERGGGILLEDRQGETREVLQVTPALSWGWTGKRLGMDFRIAPVLDVPPRRPGRPVSGFSGQWRGHFLPSERALLESRVHGEHVDFSQSTLWRGRTRGGGDLFGSFKLRETVYITGGYSYSHASYGWRNPGALTRQASAAPKPGRRPSDRGKSKKAEETSVGIHAQVVERPDETLPQFSAATLAAREDDLHGLRSGLVWAGPALRLSAGAETNRNRSSLPEYSYEGIKMDVGAGVERGPLGLDLQTGVERRHYDPRGKTDSVWRFMWLSGRATWRLTDRMRVFAEIQREYGTRDGEQAFAPWTFAAVGFKLTLPLPEPSSQRTTPRQNLRPYPTQNGWTFRFQDADARSVHLIGTFCSWNPKGYSLHPAREGGLWEITVPLKRGVYEYAFLVDGNTWVVPPAADLYVEDGFGNRNGVVVVQ